MKPSEKWNLRDFAATVAIDSLQVAIDTSKPATGGRVSGWENEGDSSPVVAALFQIGMKSDEVMARPETYCRGKDLITRYPATEQRPIDHEIYWRLNFEENEPECVNLETIFSLQTDLLNSSPQPAASSTFSEGSPRWMLGRRMAGKLNWSPCSWDDAFAEAGDVNVSVACVFKDEAGHSILQTVYPPDLRSIEVSETGEQVEVYWQLRSEFLEKGVIRRLRMLTVFGSSESNDDDLLSAVGRFVESELPLTA